MAVMKKVNDNTMDIDCIDGHANSNGGGKGIH
jgi:hypothetical protein